MTIADTTPSRIAALLASVGVSTKIKGYRFLARAIELVLEDESRLSSVTKILYPRVAKDCVSTPSRVERAIRHAITTAWAHGDHDQLRALFGASRKAKPTNSEFIANLAEQLRG